MKKSVLFTTVLILGITPLTMYAQYGWFPQISNTNAYLTTVHFPAANTGFAAGFSGVLLRTTNGGDVWELQTIEQYSFRDIYFPSVNTGYVVGAGGVIMKTTNSGISWFLLLSPTSMTFGGVYFTNNYTGYAAGFNGLIVKTTNGGETWFELVTGTSFYFTSIYFADDNTGYATGQYGLLIKTTNAGANWIDLSIVWGGGLGQVFFTNLYTGYITGTDGLVGKTTNEGLNWSLKQVGYTFYDSWHSVHFPDDDTGYICGNGGWQMKTTNAGLNWFFQAPGTLGNLEEIFFSSRDTGYIVASGGEIFKTVSGGTFVVGVKKIESSIPHGYLLHQNYPNPFNPLTRIKFDIPAAPLSSRKGIAVKLYVYDILGREVTTLVDKKLEPGVYEIDWNASNLSAGLYFYTMKAGDFLDTKKMVLVK